MAGFSGEDSSDVTGIRAQAREAGMSEDFDRFDDDTLQKWEEFRDKDCPPKYPYRMDPGHINKWFKGQYNEGACVEKPIDTGGVTQQEGGRWGPSEFGGGQKGGEGGEAGQPAVPPPPTTFGEKLSFTGNPMQDMLIQQFNARTQVGDPTRANIFGLGMDRQVGGEGLDADKPMMAQALAGGGLWSGSKETFGGFRADQQNVGLKPKKRRGRRRGGPSAPTPEEIAAPPGAPPAPEGPTTPPWADPESTEFGDMMKKKFGDRRGPPRRFA